MAILCQDIVDRLNSALDAEAYDFYVWDRDFQPAINYAVEFACSGLDRMLGKTRFVEERLQDLIFTGCWKTDNLSRFQFNETVMSQKLWAIVAIYMNPTTSPTTTITQANPLVSVFSPTHTYVKSYKSAWRSTAEEVSQSRKNPFAPGNELHADCDELAEWAYLSPVTYWGGLNTPPISKLIQIVPDYVNKVLAMEYIKYPTPAAAITDSVELPASMTDLIVDKALAFLTYKRGDGNLQQMSEMEVSKLTSMLK